jgi:hypothetical protein
MHDDVVPPATLHLLTGPWASGKSSLVPHLARLLPEVVVFDWDALLPGLSAAAGKDAHADTSTWEGLRAMWAAVAGSVLAGGRDVLLCGPALPQDLAESGVGAHPVRCAYLDCGDEILAERLRTRGETEAEISDELAFMAALRRSDHAPVRAGERPPPEIAAEVAAWVRAVRPPQRTG